MGQERTKWAHELASVCVVVSVVSAQVCDCVCLCDLCSCMNDPRGFVAVTV